MFGICSFSAAPFSSTAGNVYAVSVVESVSAQDQILALVSFNALVVEALQGSETVSSAFVFNASVQESITATDTLSSVTQINSSIDENINVSDTKTAQVTFPVSVDEGIAVDDSVSTAIAVLANVVEGIAAADSFIGTLLWDTINTSDTSVWTPIETVALSLRVTVGGGFSSGAFSSGPISGLGGDTKIIDAPDNWTAIDTTQPNDWTPVKTQT